MHLTAAGYLEPAGLPAYPAARAAAKYAAHVELGRGFGEREKRRPKARSQLLVFEELAQKIGENAFQIGEAHRLVYPKALHLVEHRSVRRVRIDAVHPAGRDDLERRLVMLHVAHLDRRGVRAQEQVLASALQVKRVVHRPRGVVLRLIERSEVVEVGLDLGTVRHVEPDRAKKLLDALERPRRRMQAAAGKAAPRQSHVQRPFCEPRIELGGGQGLAAGRERRFDPVLGGIDACPGFAAGPGCELGEVLHRRRERSRFPEVTRLDALELVRVVRAAELGDRTRNNFIQIDHLKFDYLGAVRHPSSGEGCFQYYAPSLAFAWLASCAKAVLSTTARSASTLRSTSIEAFFRPCMKAEYVMPCSRTAALMRAIQRARNCRLRCLRSR